MASKRTINSLSDQKKKLSKKQKNVKQLKFSTFNIMNMWSESKYDLEDKNLVLFWDPFLINFLNEIQNEHKNLKFVF